MRGQLMLTRELEDHQQENPDRMLAVSNQIYAERMLAVRHEQKALLLLEEDSPEANAKREEIAHKLSAALFFAPEAYHAKGTVQHIVAGNSGDDNTARTALTVDSLLNSFNKQLGDFNKVFQHHTGSDAFFLKSAEPLQRMLEAAMLLREKRVAGDVFVMDQWLSLEQLYLAMNNLLLPLRNNEEGLTPEEAEDRAKKVAAEMLGIPELTPMIFQSIVQSINVQVNTRLRDRQVQETGARKLTKRAPALEQLPLPIHPDNWTDDYCKMVIGLFGANWTTLQDQLKTDPASLSNIVAFRKRYVDGLIEELRTGEETAGRFGGLVANSVGSTDYDLTLGLAGTSGDDVEAVPWLNRRIVEDFGNQPGTVFDTNFYVNNFIRLTENLISTNPPSTVASATPVRGPEATADQAIMVFIKKRRYMDQHQWLTYTGNILVGITDPVKADAVRNQLDSADALYLTGTFELLERAGRLFLDSSLDAADEALLATQDPALQDTFQLQLLLSKKYALVQEQDPDLILRVSNELYIERMGRVRKLQAQAETEADAAVKAVLEEDVQRLLSDALFFASEAYHARGTIQHIVVAGQSGDSITLEVLTPAEIFNPSPNKAVISARIYCTIVMPEQAMARSFTIAPNTCTGCCQLPSSFKIASPLAT